MEDGSRVLTDKDGLLACVINDDVKYFYPIKSISGIYNYVQIDNGAIPILETQIEIKHVFPREIKASTLMKCLDDLGFDYKDIAFDHPELHENANFGWKYHEDKIVNDLRNYLQKTYGEHYKAQDGQIECFDAWVALGDSGPTFRNTALKYLWRYGKKAGKNQSDLWKAFHYLVMLMFVEHYKK